MSGDKTKTTLAEQDFLKKQRSGIYVRKASWICKRGKPDIPENWHKLKVWLDDNSVFILSAELVAKFPPQWYEPKEQSNG